MREKRQAKRHQLIGKQINVPIHYRCYRISIQFFLFFFFFAAAAALGSPSGMHIRLHDALPVAAKTHL